MKDFIGFRFGNIHTKDLNLVVVSSSDRYQKNLLPDPKDYTIEVPGGDGSYYFGQTFNNREFTCEVAFDGVTEENWRKISQLFSTDKLQDLVFDELPYKTYKAKLKSRPEFKFICFTDRETGERVYKGEGTLNFICYFPYAFGFNKYIVRAADYYNTTPPETIIRTHTEGEHEYANNLREPVNKNTKDYYKVANNMESVWKGGYPTIEQVQAGELFFNEPNIEKGEQKKCIIDVRDYWENVPEWALSSKLLTTPTLDYDQELIYMPQYSSESYINMDIGINQDNAMIGSRFLVYNPGDLPIDFNMDLLNNERSFKTGRGNRFQIRRFNVERLPIPSAVDWTGLKTYNTYDEEENDQFKYGNKYFKIPANNFTNEKEPIDITGYYESSSLEIQQSVEDKLDIKTEKNQLIDLGNKHPNHTYLVEPFAREKLGDYIRMFFWQSSLTIVDQDKRREYNERGKCFADRYEELFNLCISEYEEYELYWKTLKDLFFEGYGDKKIFKDKSFIKGFEIEGPNFGIKYILEVTRVEKNDKTSEIKVNFRHKTQSDSEDDKIIKGKIVLFEHNKNYYKFRINENEDLIYEIQKGLSQESIDACVDGDTLYFEVDGSYNKYYQIQMMDEHKCKLFEKIGTKAILDHSFARFFYDFIYNPPEFIHRPKNTKYGDFDFNNRTLPQWHTLDYLEILTEDIPKERLFLNTDKRMLYNENVNINLYNPSLNIDILNDSIIEGHWFKIPKGWSLIEVIPVCDEDQWGNKRWLDARPFNWGYGGFPSGNKKPIQLVFDRVYENATNAFLEKMGFILNESISKEEREYYLQIRRWFMNELEKYKTIKTDNNEQLEDKFIWEFYKNLEVQVEYELLKTIAAHWNCQKGISFIRTLKDETGKPIQEPGLIGSKTETIVIKGSIDEWWWYACNYIWANFPPLPWGYVDILNKAKIDYIPLFY